MYRFGRYLYKCTDVVLTVQMCTYLWVGFACTIIHALIHLSHTTYKIGHILEYKYGATCINVLVLMYRFDTICTICHAIKYRCDITKLLYVIMFRFNTTCESTSNLFQSFHYS